VDESFIELSDDPVGSSMLPEAARRPNVAIVKSLSKAYGIAGLRLGFMYSDNASLLASVRGALPIWNVNGFAEAFLRLLPSFRTEFRTSCETVRADTLALYAALRDIPGGRATVPQANFVFWRVPAGLAAADLADRLFVEHQILIKDCSGKAMENGSQYVRIASRTPAENERLVGAIHGIVSRCST
jgi:threonine-phosphate decarboxylase